MAFNTAEGRAEYSATSGQTLFTFNFKIYQTSDIKVYLTPAGTTPNDATDILTETTDYTVSINGDNGGLVTLVSPAVLDDSVTFVRILPNTRDTEYQALGDLYSGTLNMDQDYQTYLISDRDADASRYLAIPNSSQGVSTELPAPVGDSYIRWSTDGKSLENDTTIPQAVVDAADSAAAALVSENNSQTSVWESEAEAMTSESYATQPLNEDVIVYTSNNNGTFTATPQTGVRSSLHHAIVSEGIAPLSVGNINAPLLDLPLKNSTAINKGVGSVTTTRATSATITDRYGSVKDLAIDEIGFNEDGILIEGESTNLVTFSDDYTDASWVKSGVTPTAGQITEDSSTGFHYIFKNLTTIADEDYTFQFKCYKTSTETDLSFQLWNVTDGAKGIRFNPQAGALIVDGTGGRYLIKEYADYYFVYISITPTVPNITTRIMMGGGTSYTGDGATFFNADNNQVEELSYPSSYIPTTTTVVTRTASLTTATAYDNIPNLNEDWSFKFDLTVNGKNTDGTESWFLGQETGAGDNYIIYNTFDNNSLQCRLIFKDSVSNKTLISTVAHDIGETKRYVFTFDRASNEASVYVDGILTNSINTISELEVQPSLIRFNGTWGDNTIRTPFISLKNVAYYDRTLTAEEVRIS